MTERLPRTAVEPAILLPPRPVPLCVRLSAIFGGVLQQLGWAFFGFGMIFFYAFAMQADITGPLMFVFDRARTSGVVLRVEGTNASENDEPVYAVDFRFVTTDGHQVEARAYSTGYAPDAGTRVPVEYVRSQPEIARISGMRRTMFGPAAVFAGIFPLIGLVMAVSGLYEGIKNDRLLHQGRLAFGKLKSAQPTGTRINNRPVMAMTFAFRAQDGVDYEVVSKTDRPERLEDQQEELILFDPNNPEFATALDALAGSPSIDNAGVLTPGKPAACLAALILPGLAILGNGLYLLIRFTK